MPPLPVIADTYRVALNWRSATLGHAANVMHFRGAPGSAAGLYTSLNNRAIQNLWYCVSNTAVVDSVDITPLDGSSATIVNSTGAPAKWQGFAGTDSPPAVSAIVKLRTAKRGKSYRGRIFLPWVTESQQANGALDAAAVTAMQAAWILFRTNVATDGYTMVIASYLHATAELVTTSTVEGYTGTQRRRLARLR